VHCCYTITSVIMYDSIIHYYTSNSIAAVHIFITNAITLIINIRIIMIRILIIRVIAFVMNINY